MRALSYHTQCCQLLWVSLGHFVYAIWDQVWCKDFKWRVDVLRCRTTALVIYFAHLHLAYKKVRQLLVLNWKSQLVHTLNKSSKVQKFMSYRLTWVLTKINK